jgi:hypothetical protein
MGSGPTVSLRSTPGHCLASLRFAQAPHPATTSPAQAPANQLNRLPGPMFLSLCDVLDLADFERAAAGPVKRLAVLDPDRSIAVGG